jgi:hypothetical protein
MRSPGSRPPYWVRASPGDTSAGMTENPHNQQIACVGLLAGVHGLSPSADQFPGGWLIGISVAQAVSQLSSPSKEGGGLTANTTAEG